MSGAFGADWLALREPADAAACSPVLVERLAIWARARERLRVVDLGAGTGAHLRRMAPVLPPHQAWVLVERDPALIAAGERLLQGGPPCRYQPLDLADELDRVAEEAPDLITASALIDLVGADWLKALVALRARTGAALHIVLSYDGRIAWAPEDPEDRRVTALVNRHQRRDKGFGPALGPEAALVLHRLLAPWPGELLLARSDWRLGRAAAALQVALLEGYVAAAREVDPGRMDAIAAWGRRRAGLQTAPDASLRVGHLDLLFLPDS